MFSTKSKQMVSAAYRLSLRSSLLAAPKMNLFMARNRSAIQRTVALAAQQSRGFSASLPDHIKLEMPNLSPTMEKVSLRHF